MTCENTALNAASNSEYSEVTKVRCALASMGFVNEDIQYNKKVIMDTLIACAAKADIVIFGEAFLQGFYGATFNAEHDANIAVSMNDPIIQEIASVAEQYATAVSFGFIEKAEGCFYSSQMTIGSDGNVIDLYRRVSTGWKEPFASDRYREGNGFHAFSFMGKRIAVGLCGDLWFDENIDEVKKLKPDVVLWPVYTDYNFNEWNTSVKYEYAAQAGKVCEKALYVNSFCRDKEGDEVAKGGSALFWNGRISREVPSGKEALLFVEV